jgi:DNA invertase Pin-like site-specific DNA recombinase
VDLASDPFRFVAYFELPGGRKARSANQLRAQRLAVTQFLERSKGELCGEFIEMQAGRDGARSELSEALTQCARTNAILLVANALDLLRKPSFIQKLCTSNVKLSACDLPAVNEVVVDTLAAIARAETSARSERTKVALAAARRRGVKLGNPRLKAGTKESALLASRANNEKASLRAAQLREVVDGARRDGYTTLRQIAVRLNEMGIATPQGRRWHANSVRRLCHRLEHPSQKDRT